jgi:hypothetical protein
MRLILRLVVFAILPLAVRAAVGQYAPFPGQRGDPYSPLGPQGQIQQRYPLPPPPRLGPPPPEPAAPANQSPSRYPPPQPPIREPQPQPQQAGYTPSLPRLPGPAAGPSAALPTSELFQQGEVVATIGNQFVLYGDVAPTVDQILAPYAAQVVADSDRQELEKARAAVTRQVIRQIVDTKLMYLEFERQIEKNAGREKLDEVRKDIATKMRDSFEKELFQMRSTIAAAKPETIQALVQRDPIIPRMALLMRDYQAETLNELDVILRRSGSSLDKQIRWYGENRVGRETVRKQLNFKPEVTHQEMLDYYTQHAAEFAVPAKARFELLTVKFESFPTKADAWQMLAQMGNEVFFNNNFAAVARKHSQEPSAHKGGLYDWTTKGSLASKEIDEAVFSLEPGKLSQIIDDGRGYHIVRVIERQEAGQIPFLEAQQGIRDAIAAEKVQADTKAALEGLRTKTRVWTIYDDPPQVARQPSAEGTAPR